MNYRSSRFISSRKEQKFSIFRMICENRWQSQKTCTGRDCFATLAMTGVNVSLGGVKSRVPLESNPLAHSFVTLPEYLS